MSNLVLLQASAEPAHPTEGVPMDAASIEAENKLKHVTTEMGVPKVGHDGETVAMTEAHGGGAEHHEDPSIFGFATATVIVSAAMIVLLGIMIWKGALKSIGAGLDKKIADIKSQLDEASSLRAEAEKLRGEYQAKIQAAEGEANAMRARAEEEAEAILAKAKADTTDLIARRQKMAEDRIGAAERTALAEVREKAAKAATSAAASLIADKHDKSTDKGLVDKTIASLDNA